MSYRIVQVNYNFHLTRPEYERMTLPMAQPLAETPGLRWKVWLMNEASQAAGGICLFDDAAAAQRFAEETAAMFQSGSPFSNADIKQFDVLEMHSVVTRGLPKQPHTFADMAAEAMAAVPVITAQEAQHRLAAEPRTLVIDVRDASDVAITGTLPGAVNISYGALTYQADQHVPEAWRSPHLADRNRPIIVTCILGPLGAMGGKLLDDMGFTDVSILEGGVQAWIEAGLPVTKNGSN